jgi:SAM-dependent methyltransferase
MRTQRAHFDAVAAEYDDSIPEHVMAHVTRRRVALATSLSRGGRVLDVGCGTGRFLAALPDRYETVGVDISEKMLEVARARGLDVEHASADALPFPDRTFQLVTSFAVLHHLIEPRTVRAAIFEMSRVVQNGGIVVVWDHNPLNPYWPWLMRRLPQDQGDEKLVPAGIVTSCLRDSGMEQIQLRRMTFVPDFTPRWAMPFVQRIEPILEAVPGLNLLAAHKVAVAQRPHGRLVDSRAHAA